MWLTQEKGGAKKHDDDMFDSNNDEVMLLTEYILFLATIKLIVQKAYFIVHKRYPSLHFLSLYAINLVIKQKK